MTTFKANLAKGMKFEDRVTGLLKIHYPISYILPTHDFKTGNYCGPRLLSANNPDITFPDFLVVGSTSKSILVEAKLKRKTFRLPGNALTEYVGIDESKVNDYRRAAGIMNADLVFAVGIETTKKVYLIQDRQFVLHQFNNSYARGKTCCLEIDQKDYIGNM